MHTAHPTVCFFFSNEAKSRTDTVNTDQRRIPLNATANGTTYTMALPVDAGVLIPGYYYLFAMAAGVPSVATFVSVALG